MTTDTEKRLRPKEGTNSVLNTIEDNINESVGNRPWFANLGQIQPYHPDLVKLMAAFADDFRDYSCWPASDLTVNIMLDLAGDLQYELTNDMPKDPLRPQKRAVSLARQVMEEIEAMGHALADQDAEEEALLETA